MWSTGWLRGSINPAFLRISLAETETKQTRAWACLQDEAGEPRGTAHEP